jgi:hypothetical protein
MTTPTERGFVTTYTHCNLHIMGKPVAVVKKDKLKLIQEEEERSMGSKLALEWAIQLLNYINLVPGRIWCASCHDRLSLRVCLYTSRLAFVIVG